jgi:glycerol-3-phosphate dehydrogenase
VLRAESLAGLSSGLHLPVPGSSGHFALVLPQEDGRIYVGLTDEPADGPVPDVPVPSEAEIGFLLDLLDSALDVPVRRTDVAGAYAGLRPLLDGAGGSTADLSRRHAVLTSGNGVVTIVGGKLTTYRRMAQDAVDAVIEARGLNAGPCRTTRLPLVGAGPARELARLVAPAHLVRRYGAEARDVLALAAEDPALLEPVAPGSATIGAELAWAVRHEGALDEGDLLDRRTRVGLVAADREAALAAARRALAPAASPL